MFRARRYRVLFIFAAIFVLAFVHFARSRDWSATVIETTPEAHTPRPAGSETRPDLKTEYKPQDPPAVEQNNPIPPTEPDNKIPDSPPPDQFKSPVGANSGSKNDHTKIDPENSVKGSSDDSKAAGTDSKGSSSAAGTDTKTNENPLEEIDHGGSGRVSAKPPTSGQTEIRWKKFPDQFPIPADELLKLPKGQSKTIPKLQAKAKDESSAEKQERIQQLSTIKAEFKHAWQGYKKVAMGHDELKPLTNVFDDPFNGWGATLVDSLDTLWIMDLKEEFSEAIDAVKKIDFTTSPRKDIPVFETTIRYLGGLLGAYDISGQKHAVLLEKAQELAEILIGVFDTPNRMPVLYYNWHPDRVAHRHRASNAANLAEIGSLSLEFTRLAQLTKQDKYYDAIARITNELEDLQDSSSIPGLWPTHLNAQGCAKYNSRQPDSGVLPPPQPRSPTQEHPSEVHKPYAVPTDLKSYSGLVSRRAAVDLTQAEPASNGHGNAQAGNVQAGKSQAGNAQVGNVQASNAQAGSVQGGSVQGGSVQAGNAQSGNVKSGNVQSGNVQAGNAQGGSVQAGNVQAGKSQAGNAQPGKVQVGNAQGGSVQGGSVQGGSVQGGSVQSGVAGTTEDKCNGGLMLPSSPRHNKYSLGGSADSTYEYLPKEYLLLGGMNDQYKNMYKKAIDAARKNLVFQPMVKGHRDLRFMASTKLLELERQGKLLPHDMVYDSTHLTCFVGGMVAVGAKAFGIEADMDLAYKLTDGCVWAYESTSSGLMPEGFQLFPCPKDASCDWDEELIKADSKRLSGLGSDKDAQFRNGESAYGQRVRMNTPPESEPTGKAVPLPMPGSLNPHDTDQLYKRELADGKLSVASPVSDDKAEGVKNRDTVHDSIRASSNQPLQADHGDQSVHDSNRASPNQLLQSDHTDQTVPLPAGMTKITSPEYLLRPEAIESVFVMFRLTGDDYWRKKGWKMFEAIIKHSKTETAHAAIKNVNTQKIAQKDTMESFWLAETLKYFYLLFSDPSVVDLDKYVLNTEAHPFLRPV